MFDLSPPLALPVNEPIFSYAPGAPERTAVKLALVKLAANPVDIPHVIDGKERLDGDVFEIRSPHRRSLVLGTAHQATESLTNDAIMAAKKAARNWADTPFEARARIFLKAADLLAGPYRATLNAATMLGQSKTAYQAEIDAACELIDFLRFNVAFATRLAEQPISPPGFRNVLELRALEGFVLAVTPFNFTAIAGNLPCAPALLGNVVVWKPAETQSLAAFHTMNLLRRAGLPDGVINVVYGHGAPVANACLASRDLAGIHFTGSTQVFQHLVQSVGKNIASYRTYPRLVGETGGKDFVFADASADVDALAIALVRGAFEYQGQKCSAASRAYVPESLWPELKERLVAHTKMLRMGDVADFQTFLGAVIDDRAFARLTKWQARLKSDSDADVFVGGGADSTEGWFVEPTIVQVKDPRAPVLAEELFGPILAIYVYPDNAFEETLRLLDETSPYALTGAIFSQDRQRLALAAHALKQAAGNLYINDKPTGAVVGQQPFGGARGSGTNDKAGSAFNLLRWTSPRVIKETFVPSNELLYPSMREP